MSSTNRAFIKAYRQDTADSSPVGGASPTVRGPNGATMRAVAERTNTSVRDAAYSAYEARPIAAKRPLSSFIGSKPSTIGRGQGEPRPAPGGRESFGAENENAN